MSALPVPAPPAFRRQQGEDGVLVLTLDVPGEKVNTLSKSMLDEFNTLLHELEAGQTGARALVIVSGKPDSFIAGADIKDFTAIRSALEGEALSRAGQAAFTRIENLPMPTVAAINGTCLGGGLE